MPLWVEARILRLKIGQSGLLCFARLGGFGRHTLDRVWFRAETTVGTGQRRRVDVRGAGVQSDWMPNDWIKKNESTRRREGRWDES